MRIMEQSCVIIYHQNNGSIQIRTQENEITTIFCFTNVRRRDVFVPTNLTSIEYQTKMS